MHFEIRQKLPLLELPTLEKKTRLKFGLETWKWGKCQGRALLYIYAREFLGRYHTIAALRQ